MSAMTVQTRFFERNVFFSPRFLVGVLSYSYRGQIILYIILNTLVQVHGNL